MSKSDKSKGTEVPTGKFSRMSQLGSMASKIAGNMLMDGLQEWSKGNKPKVKDLLLTPGNMLKVADQLAKMRGAAMKVGQLISMDAGDLLPPELADILARLRSDAAPMPKETVEERLAAFWGPKWRQEFIQFSEQPIAAASIGQVHKGVTRDLKRVAVKIQYPGIRQSIDSDVDNVAILIKMSGLLPKNLNIKPLLAEAKKQLHEEADYLREAEQLQRFGELLADDECFLLPKVYPEMSSNEVLVMEYMDGEPIEQLANAEQSVRDAAIHDLFRLFFAELFDYQLMQTDPNYANFLFDQDSQKLVLLDFGATRAIPMELASGYLQMMRAAQKQDSQGVWDAALSIGLINPDLPSEVQQQITYLCMLACEPLYLPAPYDFATSDLAMRLQEQGFALGMDRAYAHTPPADCIFIHRKLGGLFLLALKLKANVDFTALFAPYQ